MLFLLVFKEIISILQKMIKLGRLTLKKNLNASILAFVHE